MIVLGYIERMRWDYRCYAEGRCPDSWRGFADNIYNPRHVPSVLAPVYPAPPEKEQS
jgi:hypothetical protein